VPDRDRTSAEPPAGRAPTIADRLGAHQKPDAVRASSLPHPSSVMERHDARVGTRPGEPAAWFGGVLATELVEVSSDPGALDRPGWWAVVLTYEGELTAARFEHVRAAPLPDAGWVGVPASSWTSSLGQTAYEAGVGRIRDYIAAGDVYQANLCRVLSASLSSPPEPGGVAPPTDVAGLAGLLATGNPAPYGGFIRLPEQGVHVATASPELFLRRNGTMIESGPIKGTGRTAADLLPKDEAENVMIADLVRNDLGRVSEPGSITVPDLLAIEQHPGLVHLVSRVRGNLRPDVGWRDVLAATFPPGSVTGAPKSSAVRIIAELETVPRQVYCGAVGWVDGTAATAELAVAIRTFWIDGNTLRFGTGAGITWGSDAYGEWVETELKASRLLAVAAQEAKVFR
jgi:para-aminobenzoate synthetase component I